MRWGNVDNCRVNDVEGFTFCLYEWAKWFGFGVVFFFTKAVTFYCVSLKQPLVVFFSEGVTKSTHPLQNLCVTCGQYLSFDVGFYSKGIITTQQIKKNCFFPLRCPKADMLIIRTI